MHSPEALMAGPLLSTYHENQKQTKFYRRELPESDLEGFLQTETRG